MFTSAVELLHRTYAVINKLYTTERLTGGWLHLLRGAVRKLALVCLLYRLRWGHLSPCGGGGGSRALVEERGRLRGVDGSSEGSTGVFRALKGVWRPSLGGLGTRLCSHR